MVNSLYLFVKLKFWGNFCHIVITVWYMELPCLPEKNVHVSNEINIMEAESAL